MTGTVKKTTVNYSLRIPYFDKTGWGREMERNFDILDAAIFAATSLSGITGIWQNNFVYAQGDRVVDPETNSIWRCDVAHTSAATGTFAADRVANPTYWEAITQSFNYVGQWTAATNYVVNDIVFDGHVWAIAISSFESDVSLAQDITNGDFVILFDGTAIFDATEAERIAAVAAKTAAETAETAAELAQSLAELAETNAETAEANAELAEGGAIIARAGAETAQGLAEAARDAALLAEVNSESARDLSIAAKDLAEAAAIDAEFSASIAQSLSDSFDPVVKSGATPSLDLNFTGPGAEIGTFSRASTGTYFDATGVMRTAAVDAPRYNHDPATGECLGLLIESAATNLLTYSEQLDNAVWTKSNSTITANATLAPDGTLTADKVVENTSNSLHAIGSSSSIVSGTTYVYSVFAKAAERSRIRFVFSATGFPATSVIYYDLATGLISGISGSITASGMEPCGDGWYRCWAVLTADDTGSTFIQVRLGDATSDSYLGDGTSGAFIWGAQLETGPYASSYIPTVASAVTRSADVYSAALTGWCKQSAGTFYTEVTFGTPLLGTTTQACFMVSDGTANNELRLFRGNTGSIVALIDAGGVNQTQIVVNTSPIEETKTAFAYSTNDIAVSFIGQTALTDNTATLPSVNILHIGNYLNTLQLNGHIKRLIYWPQRLSNEKLVEITS